MDVAVFQRVRTIAKQQRGIELHEGKKALAEARLGSRLKALGLKDERAYLEFLEKDKSGGEMVQFLNAISTNVTHFFREAAHFDVMEEVFGRWAKEGQRRFRIWCGASSTGEEPYSMGMVLHQLLSAYRVDLRILATDISTRALQAAVKGQYPLEAIKKVPEQYRKRYFKSDGEVAQVVPEIQRLIRFGRLNLIEMPFKLSGPLDMVICRNVMIYFEPELRKRIVADFCRLLKPGGLLIVAHSEGLVGADPRLKMFKPSVYVKDSA